MSRRENARKAGRAARPEVARAEAPRRPLPAAIRASATAAAEVRKSYVIFFTARSGSTWLKEMLENTGRLGRPGEFFNPNLNTRFDGVPLDERIAIIKGRNQRGGVFGAELTFSHMKRVFGTPDAFFTCFSDATPIFLIREDIVMQAISLVRKRQTKVSHLQENYEETRKQIDSVGDYNGDDIRRSASNLLRAEDNCDKMFKARDINPLRLSYERNVKSPLGAVNAIARLLGEPEVEALTETELQPIRTDKSYAFAERFRKEHAEFVATLEEKRSARLAKLANY